MDIVDQIRSVARLDELVSADVGPGQRTRNRIRFLSPFRTERTPSFDVYGSTTWYDFGDGTGGDVFSYVMRKHGCDFLSSIEMLATHYNLTPAR